jgi:ribulose-5-phosphate 4-epimerase/fuculose-1-phosphate aldolase
MTKSFRPWRVDEVWLLPPSVQEFVAASHPAHLVRGIVREEMDLSAILSAYTEARGVPPYDPAMMVALLLYGCGYAAAGPTEDGMNEATLELAGATGGLEWQTRLQLAACYRMFARRQMDDAIFTHLSARLPGRDNRFLFIPFGMLFEEVTASNLLEVDLDGTAVSNDRAVNPAGWVVHRVVYQAIPDAACVMHLHTVTGTAVSAQACGLLPINQFGVTFHGQIAYHAYDGPGLRADEQRDFVRNLGGRRLMFLRNHGTLTQGRSIAEAFMLMHNLERTCEIQVAALAGGGELALPPQDVIDRTVATAQGVGDRAFSDVGFQAFVRQLDRADPSYRA